MDHPGINDYPPQQPFRILAASMNEQQDDLCLTLCLDDDNTDNRFTTLLRTGSLDLRQERRNIVRKLHIQIDDHEESASISGSRGGKLLGFWTGFYMEHYNRSLIHLNLSHNILGDDDIIGIASTLKNSRVLQTIILRDIGIGPRGAQTLAIPLRSNNTLHELDLSENHHLHDDIDEASKNNDGAHIATTRFRYNEPEPGANRFPLADAISVNPGLRVLRLEDTKMAHYPSHASSSSQQDSRRCLERLEAWRRAFSQNQLLEVLDLSNNPSVVYDHFSGEGAAIIELSNVFQGNQSIKELRYSGNITSSLQVLANNLESISLESLTLNEVNFLLEEPPRQRRRTNRQGGTTRSGRIFLPEVLASKRSSLQFLSLIGCHLGDDDVVKLADLVLGPPSNSEEHQGVLRHLNLSSNDIEPRGASAIAHTLEGHNRTLEELILDQNAIGTEGGMAFARAMTRSGTFPLTKLSLSNNEMGPDVGLAFGEAFQGITTTVLEGAVERGQQSSFSSSKLLDLNLYFNNLRDKGVQAICKALRNNAYSVLETINVGFNRTGGQTIRAMADAIQHSSSNVLTRVTIGIEESVFDDDDDTDDDDHGDTENEETDWTLELIQQLASSIDARNMRLRNEQQQEHQRRPPPLLFAPAPSAVLTVNIVGDKKASLLFKAIQLVVMARNKAPAGMIPHVLARVFRHDQQDLKRKEEEAMPRWRSLSVQRIFERDRELIKRWRVWAAFTLLSSVPEFCRTHDDESKNLQGC